MAFFHAMNQQAQTLPGTIRQIMDQVLDRLILLWRMTGEVALSPFYSVYQMHLEGECANWDIPQHIGIIMDGNRRFAWANGFLSLLDGHARSADKLDEVLNWCEEVGVGVVTVWVFSMDNFNREPSEVDGLMKLFEKKFLELVEHPRIHRNQVRVRTLGRIDLLPESVQKAIRNAEQATAKYSRRILNIVVAYGGRQEIVDAFRSHLRDEARRGRSLDEVCDSLQPESIEPYLYTSHVPDPDLIIRTSGEIRLSNFLLWQCAYTEFVFLDIYWPDFTRQTLEDAITIFRDRDRRYGGLRARSTA